MCEFRRTRSKVWWSNYHQEEEDDDDDVVVEADTVSNSSIHRSSVSRFSWRRSSNENNSRNSSSSPSNGSQKSQDSGFSDSESSSPSSCGGRKSDPDIQKSQSDDCTCEGETKEESATDTLPKLPETPIRITRPYLLRHKKREKNVEKIEKKLQLVKSQCNSISSYVADCYFPITSFVSADVVSPNICELPCSSASASGSPSRSQICRSSEQSDCDEAESRTCFIVDELPKKTFSDEKTLIGSTETLSSSNSDEFKTGNDVTVRFVVDVESKEASSETQVVEKTQVPCLNVDLLKNNDDYYEYNESLDISLLPEPTHTSTPKKEEVKKAPRSVKKINRRSSPVVVKENRPIDPPVAKWLYESRYRYEPECMTTLQAKSASSCYRRKATTMMIWDSTNSVLTFQHRTKLIANEFLKLYEKINIHSMEEMKPNLQSLINLIMEFIINYSQLLPRMESNSKENLLKLMDLCDRLRQIIGLGVSFDQDALLNDVVILEKFFSRFVDSVLIEQLTFLTSVLESPYDETVLLNALSGITTLSMNTSRTGELITQLNGIRNLLVICYQSTSVNVRISALRTLSVVCQNSVSIRQLEKAGGIELLSQMLTDSSRTEKELLEIVSVLVQITAPWIEDDHVIKGLAYHLCPIIDSLTRLITTTDSGETLLLCAAALANISFIEPQVVYILMKMDTISRLLTAVRNLGVRASVFLQEQVATLIANMAAVPETWIHLAQHRAVGALLCFLQVKHSPLQASPEVSAAERLQHKSAIALSRLCSNQEISKQVIELQGVTRLVKLCREERERNYSDGVLVACLASLRKITASHGNDVIDRLNAKELVEPRLVDSFLLYSSRQESYV